MMDPRQFLAALWGENPPGMLNIWMLPDQKSSWYPDLEKVNRDMQQHLHEEVYTGVALAKKEGTRFNTRSRVKEVDAAAIPGVWADIDVFHPSEKVHKEKSLPSTVEQAQEVMAKLPHSPTLIVDSGHGLQYWWLLEEPWVFRDQGEWEQARRMTQWWHRITKELFNTMGWNTDSVFDLSRIMRLPGTFNNKIPEERKEVTVIKADGPRYSLNQFAELVPENFAASVPPADSGGAGRIRTGKKGGKKGGNSQTVTGGGLVLSADAEPSLTRFEALLKADPKVRLTWEHKRSDLKDQSPSAFDMALANASVRADWPDQEVANLMIAFRRKHSFDLKLRIDYYARTIRKAKESLERDHVLTELEDTDEDISSSTDETTDQRDASEILEPVSILLGINILAVERFPASPASYVLKTDKGDVEIEDTEDLFSPAKVRVEIADATKAVIPLTKDVRKRWDSVVKRLLDACVDRDVGEMSDNVRHLGAIIEDFLFEVGVHADATTAMAEKMPYMDNLQIRVHINSLCDWIVESGGDKKMSVKTLAKRLRRLGATYDPVDVQRKVPPTRTTYRSWLLPLAFSEPYEI